MPDGLLLYAAGLVCLAGFVVRVVRADARSGGIADPGWRGWLLVGTAGVCMVAGTVQLAAVLFSA